MAAIVREFGVPTVLDTKSATIGIPDGADITVDAYHGKVYLGRVAKLLAIQQARQSHMQDTPIYETLTQVAGFIVPLRLIDPKSPDFDPDHCRSLHDIGRLVHEFSYQTMFQVSDLVTDAEGGAVKLDAPIPLDLYIIDLGGGLEWQCPSVMKGPDRSCHKPPSAVCCTRIRVTAVPRPVHHSFS